MAFQLTRNVKVARDETGTVRRLHHPLEPFLGSTDPTRSADAFGAAEAGAAGLNEDLAPRQLADQYLHEILPALELDSSMIDSLDDGAAMDGAVAAEIGAEVGPELAAEARPEEGSKLRFEKEKTVRGQSTVAYAQTAMGLPVWQAGLTVKMHGSPLRVTGAQSSVRQDLTVTPPPADAQFAGARLDSKRLASRLGLPEDDAEPQIHQSQPLIYRLDTGFRGNAVGPAEPANEQQMHVPGPTLQPVAIDDSLVDGQDYVVEEVLFNLRTEAWGDLNWRALIEPETGSVLYLDALVGCADAQVLMRDPLSETGNLSIRPSSPAVILDAQRQQVRLQGLDQPNVSERQALAGEFVRLVDLESPTHAAPELPVGEEFDFSVPTDDFSAVAAYFNCDRLFRTLRGMGFDVGNYFDGTSFPVPVDHRVSFNGQSNIVNASAPGNIRGNGSGGFRFALVERDTDVGMACEWRVCLHEFGHSILWDNLNSPNFRFAHSAGDSLAAILNDPDSRAPDRGRTFPWTIIRRRHDRRPEDGWAWGGRFDSTFRVGDRRGSDPAGYDREQILSSTLFRLYQALGGGHADLAARHAAARYSAFLIFSSAGALSAFAPPRNAEDYADELIAADLGTTDFEGMAGGAAHKVVRWAFERQGLYQPPGAPSPVASAGASATVDLFIDDGRGGGYDPRPRFVAETEDVWNRLAADDGSEHQPPVAGRDNFLYVRVQNRGQQTADGRLRVFTADSATGLWPTAWTELTADAITDSVPAAARVIYGPIRWQPNDAGQVAVLASIDGNEDRSNLATISGPIAGDRLAHSDNNIAIRSLTVAAGQGIGPTNVPDVSVSAQPALDIPDEDAIGITTGLEVVAAGKVSGIRVAIDIRHTFIGDLRVTVSSPSGKRAVLHDGAGGGRQNLIETYSANELAALQGLLGETAAGTWVLTVQDLVGQDVGRLESWRLELDLDQPTTGDLAESNPNLAIPDDDEAGIEDGVTISAEGTLRRCQVDVDIRHTFRGDLTVTLVSPAGTRAVLHDRSGGNADDLIRAYSTEDTPTVAALTGEAGAGQWRLQVVDSVGQDVGKLQSWRLKLDY